MDRKRTIIVDDDYLVRSYLKMLTAWEKAGFQIEADVRDGEEACAVMEHTKVDLIVTDISMPLMDGIELIQNVRKNDKSTYIIVLSCHDEFVYVKEAMQEGADDYVLKNTLDEDSLYQLLVNTRKKMEQKQEKSPAGMGNQNLKYIFFNKILNGNLRGEKRRQERIRAGIAGEYQNSAVVSVFMEAWEENEERWSHLESEQYCQNFLIRLREELEAAFESDSKYIETIYLGMGVFLCFLDLSDIRKSSVMQQRLTSVASICYKLCRQEPYGYGIGVSNVCIGEEAIRQAYQQARELMKMSFYDDEEILYYDVNKKSGSEIPGPARELISQWEQFARNHDRDGFGKACMAAVDSFEKERTESRLVLQWLRELEAVMEIDRDRPVYKIHKLSQLRARLAENGEEVFQQALWEIPEKVSKAVYIAAEYVLKHYKESIGLTEAAQAAGVNPAYLSYLFRQEMKVGFSNFLLSCRMKCAMEMLQKSNLKVREVAEQSGFHDYHYFAKVFKKQNGVSPAEYRKRQ